MIFNTFYLQLHFFLNMCIIISFRYTTFIIPGHDGNNICLKKTKERWAIIITNKNVLLHTIELTNFRDSICVYQIVQEIKKVIKWGGGV